MHSSTLIATAALAVGAAAQNSTSTVTVRVVQVGSSNNSMIFNPSNVLANQGDIVQFQFLPNNHSVAQASFNNPCQPIGGSNSFWSGFMPVSSGSNQVPTFSVQVQNTQPMYFYSATGNECQQGMVGAINAPTSGNTVQSFAQAAQGVQNNVAPSGSASSTSSGFATSTSPGGPTATTSLGATASPKTATGGSTLLSAARQAVFGTLLTGAAALYLL